MLMVVDGRTRVQVSVIPCMRGVGGDVVDVVRL